MREEQVPASPDEPEHSLSFACGAPCGQSLQITGFVTQSRLIFAVCVIFPSAAVCAIIKLSGGGTVTETRVIRLSPFRKRIRHWTVLCVGASAE